MTEQTTLRDIVDTFDVILADMESLRNRIQDKFDYIYTPASIDSIYTEEFNEKCKVDNQEPKINFYYIMDKKHKQFSVLLDQINTYLEHVSV